MSPFKQALRSKKAYIIAAILTVVGVGISFGAFLISTIPQLNLTTVNYSILLFIFAAVYAAIGFVWSDLKGAAARHKSKNWDEKLPDDLRTYQWKIRLSFYIPAITIFVIAMVFEIIFWTTHAYPFM